MNHPLILALALTCIASSQSVSAEADLAREQRLHNQIVDAIFDGEPILLKAGGYEFLAIHMESEAEKRKGAAIILHGRGLHPDWETVVHPLRTALPESGWDTLALQMPVLGKEAKYFDYVPTFPEAFPRIEAGIAYLKQQGIENIMLIAHSCGAHMAMNWIAERGDESIDAYIGIGMGATDYKQPMVTSFPLDEMSVPVLDIYGDKDFPAVLRMAHERLEMIKKAGHPQSAQQVVTGAEHYFNGHNDALITEIRDWLDGLKPK